MTLFMLLSFGLWHHIVVWWWMGGKPHLTENCSVLCHMPMMNIAYVILCTWTVVCSHLWYYC